MCNEAPARPSDAPVSTRYTVPFKFIHDKDGQAHQHHRHQHDDCSAAVDDVAGVHQRSFEGESMKEKLRAHASRMRTKPVVRGTTQEDSPQKLVCSKTTCQMFLVNVDCLCQAGTLTWTQTHPETAVSRTR